jgi:primase-polymerase (primpol)-like protein
MTHKPYTFIANIAALPKALQHLTRQKRWVNWKWELRKNKWTKPPYQCSNPALSDKTNDPSTWGSYEEAIAVVAAGKADGIGFMLKDS